MFLTPYGVTLTLPVTSRAARHHILAANFVFFFKIGPFCGRKVAVLPLHIKDLGFRPDEFFRLAVACETPFHLQSIFLINCRHIIDLPVTGRTPNAFSYMYAVVKICEFRKIVDAFPLDRLIIAEARPDRFEIRAVGPYLAMAIHTRLCWRNSG